MSANNGAVGAVLRQARQDAGMRQGELAAALGVSIWVMNRVELGARRFDHAWLSRLPAAIRLPVAAAIEAELSSAADEVRYLSRRRRLIVGEKR